MLSSFQTFETLLFSLMNFAPFVLLSIFTFYDQMRFSKNITYTVCGFLIAVQFATRYWSVMNNISLSVGMSILRLIIFILCYMALFDIHWGKVLFVELIFANIGNFIIIAAVCLERNLFSSIEHRLYCWHTSIAMFLLHLIITVPYIFTLKQYFKPMIVAKGNYLRWNYYWLIPAIFYLIWQYQIHGGSLKGLDVILNPHNVIFLFIINIGSYLIYQLIIQLDSQLILNIELEREKHFHDIELLEQKLLEARIEEARRARHDLRHHLIVVEDYLNTEDYDSLKAYVSDYSTSLPENEPFQFCSHRGINTLLMHYGHIAKEKEIDYEVTLSISNDMEIPNSDISVLLSNLLENAVQACETVTDIPKKIIIRGKGTKASLFFTIDNTCNNEIRKDKQDRFLTTKKNGSGIGIESAKHIVERYNGVFTAEKKEDIFYVSFMLNL